jgi:hypothetical protein
MKNAADYPDNSSGYLATFEALLVVVLANTIGATSILGCSCMCLLRGYAVELRIQISSMSSHTSPPKTHQSQSKICQTLYQFALDLLILNSLNHHVPLKFCSNLFRALLHYALA